MREAGLADPILKTAWNLCDRSYWEYSASNKDTDTQFLASDEGIAFRGTTNLFDWITNLKTRTVVVPFEKTSPKIKIHKGFIEAYHSVRPLVLAAASKLENPIIAGHSLGGAIATIAAIDIQYNLKKSPVLITFATPKIGNKEWARSASQRLPQQFHFVNTWDIVHRVPVNLCHPVETIALDLGWFDPHNLKIYASLSSRRISRKY